MQKLLLPLTLIFCCTIFGQKKESSTQSKYWEDQTYISFTYNNILNKTAKDNIKNFSYAFSLGYIKDIPIIRSGKIALGIGLGYDFSGFNHSLSLNKNKLINIEFNSKEKTFQHNIELPLQFRWRNSSITRHEFWRMYLGARISYALPNSVIENLTKSQNTINKIRSGAELSIGYNRVNFYVYYGFDALYNKKELSPKTLNPKLAKLGFIFYLL